MRFIKIHFPANKTGAITAIVEQAETVDWAIDTGYGRYEKAMEIVVEKGKGQPLLDALQSAMSGTPDWRSFAVRAERGVRYFISADCFRVERGASAHMAVTEKSRTRR